MTSDQLEQEIVQCRDCRVFDPDNQPSVQRRLEEGWDPDVWTIKNGMSLNLGSGLGSVPLHTDYVLCAPHEKKAEEVWGE